MECKLPIHLPGLLAGIKKEPKVHFQLSFMPMSGRCKKPRALRHEALIHILFRCCYLPAYLFYLREGRTFSRKDVGKISVYCRILVGLLRNPQADHTGYCSESLLVSE